MQASGKCSFRGYSEVEAIYTGIFAANSLQNEPASQGGSILDCRLPARIRCQSDDLI